MITLHNVQNGVYNVKKDFDANGFETFLKIVIKDEKIFDIELDAEHPELGIKKKNNPTYNLLMKNESGCSYKDASNQLIEQIKIGIYPLKAVKGARYLSEDAQELWDKICVQMNFDPNSKIYI